MQEASNKSTMTAIADVIWLIAAIGAINWGLIGWFNINIVDKLFADAPTRIIYMIIGICGVVALFLLPVLRVKSTIGRSPAHDRG